jgi:uncharacterized membrane protein YwaF
MHNGGDICFVVMCKTPVSRNKDGAANIIVKAIKCKSIITDNIWRVICIAIICTNIWRPTVCNRLGANYLVSLNGETVLHCARSWTYYILRTSFMDDPL